MDEVADRIYAELNGMVTSGDIKTFTELEAMKRVFVSLNTLLKSPSFANPNREHTVHSPLETHHQQTEVDPRWIVRHTILFRVRKRVTKVMPVSPPLIQSSTVNA